MRRKFRPMKLVVKGVTPETIFSYKDPEMLRQFLSAQGKIASRSRSGITAKQQRGLTRAIKRARVLAMLPYAR